MTWHEACNNEIAKEPKLGWKMEDNSFRHIWFTGPQMPDSVVPDEEDAEDDNADMSTHLTSDTDDDDDDDENGDGGSETGRESDEDDE